MFLFAALNTSNHFLPLNTTAQDQAFELGQEEEKEITWLQRLMLKLRGQRL
jgi:hypothetical protein